MKRTSTIFIALFLAFQAAGSENIDKVWLEEHYNKTEVMIPTRDSISLYTAIYVPKDLSPDRPRPMLMMRTPYGCGQYGTVHPSFRNELRNYYLHDYIIVLQDVRGRYMSGGRFINLEEKPEDTWDTVEWLVSNVPGNNGKVGITGHSYPGYYALMAAICGHPAIKAVSAQAPVMNWYMGDDAHHNGALMLLDTYFFGRSFYRTCPNPTTAMPPVENRVDKPVYEFFLDKMTIRNISETFPDPLPFWEEMAAHPDYDSFWERKTPAPRLTGIKPAVLITGGAFDTDDCYGALNAYRLIRKQSPETEVHLVYGPWYHGTWRSSDFYLDEMEFPFFSRHLEGKGQVPAPVTVIPSVHSRKAAPEPVRQKEKLSVLIPDQWPAPDSVTYYLQPDDSLSESIPENNSGEDSCSSYISDPYAPVPHYEKEIWKKDRRYMIGDQSFVNGREDVLTFTAAPQEDTLKLLGPVHVELYAEATTGDADFVVKVIDTAPDGYCMLVRWDVMRGRYRNGFGKPEPIEKGEICSISFTMNDLAHFILPGHQLTVQIQSSFFPAIDLNPGTFVPNIYEADIQDFVKTSVKIHHSQDYPSHLTFRILPSGE